MPALNPLAQTIFKQKYSLDGKEEWPDTASRVVSHVVGLWYPELVDEITTLVAERKFMPGGRYLYASGRRVHQVNNCVLLRPEDSREGWANHMYKTTMSSMTGAGLGGVYSDLREEGAPVSGMGGTSTGPMALIHMTNEGGRYIMQGGSRRVALWAGLHWNHGDIFKFITAKDWDDHTRERKEKDFSYPAPLDLTNISVILDDDFFAAYDDPRDEMHSWAQKVYWMVIEKMLTTGEPGFSIDTGDNRIENLRNAPLAGDTNVLTSAGYQTIGAIVGTPTSIWTGQRWAHDVVFKETWSEAKTVRVTMSGGRVVDAEPSHPFLVERYQGAGSRRKLVSIDRINAEDLVSGDILHVSLPEAPDFPFNSDEYTLGWIYGDGSFTSGGGADLTLCSDESKACLPYLSGYHSVNEEDGRGFTRLYFSVKQFIGKIKDQVPQQDLTPSFIGGLFDADGNWEPTQHRIRLASKHESFLHDVRRGLERLGIIAHVSKAGLSSYGQSQGYQLVIASEFSEVFADVIPTKRLRPEFSGYQPYRTSMVKVLSVTEHVSQPVYCADVGVDEHSFMAEGVIVSNCTEVTSEDDSDVCNLGSLNLAQFDNLDDFKRAVELSTIFLLCGTLYSMLPYDKIGVIREKNRRLGLGLMGIYEWLAVRGKPYAPDSDLQEWLEAYAESTEIAARHADHLGISRPVKTRALAPNGTIAIIAGTTSGIEPLFAQAYKRRYRKGKDKWMYQYVIDSTTERLVERGLDPSLLETAYDMAKDPERRIAFQTWVQQYVDHGISSTLNLPEPEKQTFSHWEFGEMLMGYLPYLRGITAYPNGARGGQPLTAVSYEEAAQNPGVELEEVSNESGCVSGVCGL